MSESPNSVRSVDLRSVDVLTAQQLDPLTTQPHYRSSSESVCKTGRFGPTNGRTDNDRRVSVRGQCFLKGMALQLASRYGASRGRIRYHNDYGSNESRYDARAIQRLAIEMETSLARAWGKWRTWRQRRR